MYVKPTHKAYTMPIPNAAETQAMTNILKMRVKLGERLVFLFFFLFGAPDLNEIIFALPGFLGFLLATIISYVMKRIWYSALRLALREGRICRLDYFCA